MAVFYALWHADMRNFHVLNEALTILLPKTCAAATIKDYRPISLIHVVGKLIAKVLGNKLGPRLDQLAHHNQSTFIKCRFIQHNFKFVQSLEKLLHSRKIPSLLLKIDIARASDSVSWPFLIKILDHLGFPLA
jgi:hypothetical protein